MTKRIVGKIERKPKRFYYVDKHGNIWETEPKRGSKKRLNNHRSAK